MSTTKPPDGSTFLVVETTFPILDPLAQSKIQPWDVFVTGDDEKRYYAHNDLSEPPLKFVFTIDNNIIDKINELHFRGTPPISLSIEQEEDHPFHLPHRGRFTPDCWVKWLFGLPTQQFEQALRQIVNRKPAIVRVNDLVFPGDGQGHQTVITDLLFELLCCFVQGEVGCHILASIY